MKQAVIDIGTNTCLLLAAECTTVGKMHVIANGHQIARLGAGVDKTKFIQEESYERLKKILLEYRALIGEDHIASTAAIATSAMRDAENKEEILGRIRQDCGFTVELLSGADESIYSYRGAICGLQTAQIQGTLATVDIGGGSTELSLGRDGKYVDGKSIDIGAVRVKERFLASGHDQEAVDAARAFIRSELQHAFDDIRAHKLIAVAGTPTALAAMKLRLKVFDAKKVNGCILTSDDVHAATEETFLLSFDQLISEYPAVHPSRADILPAGALILEEVMTFLHLNEVRVSTFGLRYGIMIREFERKLHSSSDQWFVSPD